MKRNYDHYNHAKYKLLYHIILSVKYHKKLLLPIIDDLKQSIKRAQNMSSGWKVEYMETDGQERKDHHLHLLVKSKPQIALHEIIHKIKQTTTYDMWKQHHDYLSKFFWKKQHHLWTRGYFISSIGDVSEHTLREYIEKQG